MMRIIVTCSSTEFCCYCTRFKDIQLSVQSVNEYHNLLAQSCRRSRLSVSLGKHRNILPFFCIGSKLVYKLLYLRIIFFFQCILDRQRHRSIINILRSKSEMNELFIMLQSAKFVKLLFDKIFHSLDVMVSYTFNLLDTLSVSFREIAVNITQSFKASRIKALQLR